MQELHLINTVELKIRYKLQGILNACKGNYKMGCDMFSSEFSRHLMNTRTNLNRSKKLFLSFLENVTMIFFGEEYHYWSRSCSLVSNMGWEVNTSIKNVWYSQDVLLQCCLWGTMVTDMSPVPPFLLLFFAYRTLYHVMFIIDLILDLELSLYLWAGKKEEKN